jgi:hypothetical protein
VAWVSGLELQDFEGGQIAYVIAAKESGIRDTPIYLHPAQPASQQGEECRLCDNTGDIHDQTGEWRGNCPNCAHPAGDRVRNDD